VSSANLEILDKISSFMSLMKSANNSGPSIDPCGTPLSTVILLECLSPMPTFCLLPDSQLWIQVSAWPLIPHACNFLVSLLWGRLPYQIPWLNLDKLHLPASLHLSSQTSSKDSSRFVKHERPIVKPCWLPFITLCSLKCFTVILLSLTILSITLYTILVRVVLKA